VKFHELIMTRSLNKLEYTNKQAHAELAKRLVKRNTGYQMMAGERIPFVIVDKQYAKLVSDKSEDPIYAIEHHLPIDYHYYAMNQLKKPLIRLLKRVIVTEQASVVNAEKAAERILFGYDMRQMCTIKQTVSADSSIAKFFAPVAKCGTCNAPLPMKRTSPTPSPTSSVHQAPPPQKQARTNHNATVVVSNTVPPTDTSSPSTSAAPSSLYCLRCLQDQRHLGHQETLKQQCIDLEAAHTALRKRCAVCRGYDDDTACVQVDCKYMFKRAVVTSDLKMLQIKLLSVYMLFYDVIDCTQTSDTSTVGIGLCITMHRTTLMFLRLVYQSQSHLTPSLDGVVTVRHVQDIFGALLCVHRALVVPLPVV
jgi:hypothetical protein